ncbi:hypothetical protein GE061_019815 [Apolygus lucorum]|uniref:Uncharacterized protein n=1 Tax=Apolygus lucorum TaxID=248454 RepID=A0A8S9X9G0_APOLU|nr:hypothetical protein GE061_019815 [Apolygus lucorum]
MTERCTHRGDVRLINITFLFLRSIGLKMTSELNQLISDLRSEEDLLECWRRLEEHFHSIGLKMDSELTQLISDLKSEEAFEQ